MGNANMLRPSDRVDVLVHVQQDPGKGIPRTCTRTILQDIKVFAVNDQFDVSTTSGEKSVVAKTIWLLVTPEQAEKVTLAAELGQVRLVMRSPVDKEQRKLDGEDPSELLEGLVSAEPPASAPLAETPTRVEPPSAEPPPESGMNKLLELLGATNQKLNPEPGATPPSQPPDPDASWTIRIISGGQVTDTVLEREGPAAKETAAVSAPRWKIAASSDWSTPTPGPARTPAVLPRLKPPRGGDTGPDAANEPGGKTDNPKTDEKKPTTTAASLTR